MNNVILDNATQQLVYEVMKMVISAAGLVVAYYLKQWLATNAYAKKYATELGITERTIENAIDYAEKKGLEYGVKGIEKKKLSYDYLDKVDPELVSKYGNKLGVMIDRKVAQRFGYN